MSYRRSSKRTSRAYRVVVLLALLALLVSVAPAVAMDSDAGATDGCASLRDLSVGSTLAQSESWRPARGEWIKFTLQPGARYRLQMGDAASLQAAIYDRCDARAESVDLSKGTIDFTAMRGGDYYLRVGHDGASGASAIGYQVTLLPLPPHRPRITAVADVPEEVQRRAGEFFEELRGGGLAPEWAEARINPAARILYRPDIQEPAYYEFTVEKPGESLWEPAGFIQLSAGEHDYVLTQWDSSGMSPTQELAELAPLGVQLTEFYKLNSLSYASEYEELTAIGIAALADDVINLGDLPRNIPALADIPEEAAELVTEGIDSEGKTEYEGPDPGTLPLLDEEPWADWATLKANYEKDYGPELKALKHRAEGEWELEKNLLQHGESLKKGDVRNLHGLPTQTLTQVTVGGAGAAAEYLKQEELRDGGTLKGVKLTVLEGPADPETILPVEVAMQYEGGTSETVKYNIVHVSKLPPENQIFMPFLTAGGVAQAGVGADGDMQNAGSWGPWHYYWADGSAGSIRYNQFPAGSSPNTSSCWSGCGATAWAMVFAWVDQRAAENHWRWWNHDGIYRQGGGYGADVVAPLNMDTGVRNMSWELRGRLGTYCSGSGGATRFTSMINAWRYLPGRATAAWSMRTRYDPTGLCWFGACNSARSLAREQIVNYRAPAILGCHNHYPMAYGYAWRSKRSCFLWVCSTSYSRWFWVNQGWGGSGNTWINWDDVKFAGTYRN